jgi:hypothetical protein
MTPEERDALVAKALMTPQGKQTLRRAILHRHRNLREAIALRYIPALIRRVRMERLGLRVIAGG